MARLFGFEVDLSPGFDWSDIPFPDLPFDWKDIAYPAGILVDPRKLSDTIEEMAEFSEAVEDRLLPWPLKKTLFLLPSVLDVNDALDDLDDATKDLKAHARLLLNPFDILLLATIHPIVRTLVGAWIGYLEHQAMGKWKAIPPAFRETLQNLYDRDLSQVRYAEDIDLRLTSKRGITFDNLIFFKNRIDPVGKPDDLRLLLHELQHTVQYKRFGGLNGFLLEYQKDILRSIFQHPESIRDIHQVLELENEARRKAATVFEEIKISTIDNALVRFLLVKDDRGFGPADDYIDVDVVVKVHDRPDEALGFQLRDDRYEGVHRLMLDLLRDAYSQGRAVRLTAVSDKTSKNKHLLSVVRE
jgi:hypothetical protein